MSMIWRRVEDAVMISMVLLAAAWMLTVFGGCQSPNMLSAEGAKAMNMITDKIEKSGVMKEFAANMRVDVQNPGIETYLNTRISVGVRFVGTNGGVDLRTEGTGPGAEDHMPQWVKDNVQSLVDEGDFEGAAKFLGMWKEFGDTSEVEEVIEETEVVEPVE